MQSPNVAAYSFHVIGPTFEELWNHYARLCGMKQRYKENTFQISGDTGPLGSFVVSDCPPVATFRITTIPTSAFAWCW